MNVVYINPGHDTGGSGWAMKAAFDAEAPDWTARAICRTETYLHYPIDIVWKPRDRGRRMVDLPYRRRSLEEQYQAADVIHVRNHFGDYDRLAKLYGPKPVVVHYHGSRFRGDPNRHIREQRKRGAIGIVSTLDLWLLAPDDLTWLPAPYNLDELASLRP